jgi:hypothetical protein
MNTSYSMYTEFGNDAVAAVVREASILQYDWPTTLAALTNLAQRFPEDFGEATDTAVRECVYNTLGFKSPFSV